jgi:hypothetical protein
MVLIKIIIQVDRADVSGPCTCIVGVFVKYLDNRWGALAVSCLWFK